MEPERVPGPAGEAPAAVPFAEALRFWVRLGFISFGGPAGQIAVMHQEIVERRKWIGERRFLLALNYCMLLPGPEAQQLATYIGWTLHRTAGGLAAGILFVLPGALLMLLLSWLYATRGDVAWIAALFYGLRAAVIAIVAAAVLRLGNRVVSSPALAFVSAASFVAIFFFSVPFPAIILSAALAGFFLMRPALAVEIHRAPDAAGDGAATVEPGARAPRATAFRAVRVLLAGLAVWWIPLGAVAALAGPESVFTREALFFSRAAMVTFGGAYAVLAYINQAAVEQYGWLEAGQMMDGLGLAETTPGPLILVTQFVGYLGAYHDPGGLPPGLAGLLGAAVTLWATFAPCFLWIFLGAPFIESLGRSRAIAGAMSAITAAVVGVVLNLAVWFSIHTLFASVSVRRWGPAGAPVPDPSSLDGFAAALALAAFAAMRGRGWGIVPVVLGSAAAGLLWRLI